MVKRGASVPGRRFTNLVLELCGRGLTVDQIVDELHSKHPDQARFKRPNLKIKVEKMVSSKEEEEEETNATNKRQRRDDTSTTSAESNVLTLDDNHTQFDMTNESLRVSYSRPYKKKETVSFDEDGYDNDAQVKGGPMFKDLGGLNGVLEELNRYVKLPLWCRDIVQGLDMRPLSGILLHGPPGCGKTTLAYAIANETGVPFYMLSAPELVSGVSGGSEANIMKLFEKAYRTAPSVIFIDEIDAIGSKRENQHKGMDTRIVTQLLNCMEEKYMRQKLKESSDESGSKPGHVIVIGATNRPDSLDMALRRRFVKEIYLGVPDDKAREEILSKLTCPLLGLGKKTGTEEPNRNRPEITGSVRFGSGYRIARVTPGFVGSDSL